MCVCMYVCVNILCIILPLNFISILLEIIIIIIRKKKEKNCRHKYDFRHHGMVSSMRSWRPR